MNAIKSLSLGTRIIIVTLFILTVVVVVNNTVFVSGFEDSAHEAMVEKAAAFTAVADEAKNHVGKLNNDNVFSMEELLEDLQASLAAGKPVDETRIFGTIPVVAGWTAAQEAAEREHIDFHISAFEARNKTNEPKPGSFEEQLLRDLTNQMKSGGEEVAYRINEATNSLHYMRAITLGSECMMCHGVPGNEWDTDNDGKDPLGFEMESWKVGYMHGAYHVVMPLEPVDDQVAAFIGNGLAWTIPLVVVSMGLFFVLMKLMFVKPVNAVINRIRDIAEGEGDLTQRLEVNGNDELGQLSRWFNAFVEKIDGIIGEVSSTMSEVASASTEVAASSEEMAKGMTEQNREITQISAAVEEMSASVIEVARKSGEAANSAGEAGRAAETGGQVVDKTIDGMEAISAAVSASAASVTELGKRGEEIGQIIDVINDIADQTNLLALNAAIEAARAGEHGRGFAVVADEVRKLADRTTKATAEVAESIKAIQVETSGAVDRMNAGTEEVQVGVGRATEAGQSLRQIVTSSKEVAGMIQSIAAAAEQQSAASEEVSRSISSIGSIVKVAEQGASQAAEAVGSLAERSNYLQNMIGQFKTTSVSKTENAKWNRPTKEPAKILVVDDDPAIIALLQGHLKSYGQSTTASNGNSAIAAFRGILDQGKCFDLVCLDIKMPDKDGIEVLNQFREMEKSYGVGFRQRSRVVMVTAMDTPQDKLKAFKDACDGYLTKPFDKSQLERAVEQVGIHKQGSDASE